VWLALGTSVSSCGGESGPNESKAELEAELATLPPFLERDFRDGDTNDDLRIQDAEMKAMIEEDFQMADRDEDGVITAADINMSPSEKVDVAGSLLPLDLDKNGKVPLEEYTLHVEARFMKKLDTNKDGHLDPSEVSAYYEPQGKETK
jgi:hypothetical protein